MISKSTKAKRRKNYAYYKMVKTISIQFIDSGVNYFLVSLPWTEKISIHLEARGGGQLRQQYIRMLARCRKLAST